MSRLPRVLAAAHEFKFFGPVERALRDGGAVLTYDRWRTHDDGDHERSLALAAEADVVLAEWCLGNAVFHAAHRRAHQRLIVHFHRFELDKEFPARLDIDAVDLVVFAGPHFRDAAVERFGWAPHKCLYVPNPVDLAALPTAKSDSAPFTLGLLGWHRALKRLDRALDLLALLRTVDERWTLRLKGEDPREIDWVWHDREDRAFFEAQLPRIEEDPLLRGAVHVDAHGPVADWFRDVGFILSPSDVESFHLAVAEGMASGSVPVLWPREGVEQLFGAEWLHPGTEAAAEAVGACDSAERARQGARARELVAANYDLPDIAAAWRRIVLGRG